MPISNPEALTLPDRFLSSGRALGNEDVMVFVRSLGLELRASLTDRGSARAAAGLRDHLLEKEAALRLRERLARCADLIGLAPAGWRR